ncbi:hypothetical protein [Haloterrigena salinisoli]|uniref:hypothetical protein n=1 Tax=Haloterrigena salinisoli TaxID=3132747 RepID=UPI0030D555EC
MIVNFQVYSADLVAQLVWIYPVIQIFNVFFALLVTLIPLFYPSYYSKQAEKGIDELDNLKEIEELTDLHKDNRSIELVSSLNDGHNGGNITYCSISERDDGFKQISEAIQKEAVERSQWLTGVSDEIEEIRYYKGTPEYFASYFEEYSMQYGIATNYLLSVRYENGDEEPVFYNQWQPRAGLDHVQLRSSIAAISQKRSQTATSILAVIWTALAVASVTIP